MAAELAALIANATDDDLSDDGRYFSESLSDLTQCRHCEIGEYQRPQDGKLVEWLWNKRHVICDMLSTRAAPPAMDREAVERAERRLRFIAEHYGPGTSLSISDTNYLLTVLDHVRALSTLSADAIRQGEGGKDWVPQIGERVAISQACPYLSDWHDTALWCCGVRVHDSGDGLDITVTEQWPMPSRHSRGYLGPTDGFRLNASGYADDITRFATPAPAVDAVPAGEVERQAIRNEIINTPETADFMAGVPLEAAHQRERWGADHDAGKRPLDWFWLIGFLAQKAADAAIRGDIKKAKHHTISTGAALANWHAALTGADIKMRPGISAEAQAAAEGRGALSLALQTAPLSHGEGRK
ncbi:hypothetical protein [Sphingomonas parapaucimobilis]|uniref:hypothetical protein n=1 Tax=Sphingomonas parapaucimobilis TaxID=28213 RepID=UPI003219B81D